MRARDEIAQTSQEQIYKNFKSEVSGAYKAAERTYSHLTSVLKETNEYIEEFSFVFVFVTNWPVPTEIDIEDFPVRALIYCEHNISEQYSNLFAERVAADVVPGCICTEKYQQKQKKIEPTEAPGTRKKERTTEGFGDSKRKGRGKKKGKVW